MSPALHGCHLSMQARAAVEASPAIARARGHRVFGPPHLLAAILARWDDRDAGGPALLRECGLTAEQVPDLTETVVRGYDPSEPEPETRSPAEPDPPEPEPCAPVGADPPEPRPNPAIRLELAHALRLAIEAGDAYVGTEHLVLAMLWRDNPAELRHCGCAYAVAAERMATLPRLESAAPVGAIEPLPSLGAPTPAAGEVEELARQQAEQHPLGGRITTVHQLLAVLMQGAARQVLEDLGVTYPMVVERLETLAAGAVEADSRRPEELPLEGWQRFVVSVEEWDRIHGRIGRVLRDDGLWQQGVRLAMNPTEDGVRVSVHAGRSGLTESAVLARLLGGPEA
jgi:ATP-dependent Clp protease ATP-binding subunit ClpA